MLDLLKDAWSPPPLAEKARLRRSALFWIVAGSIAGAVLRNGMVGSGIKLDQRVQGADLVPVLAMLIVGGIPTATGVHRLLFGHPDSSQSVPASLRVLITILATPCAFVAVAVLLRAGSKIVHLFV
jgi:hypothetical protein